jgi:hypothetical protein
MSWQEELRRLDAELAAGRMSRHEHRKQRDELLAAVSGGGVTSPVAAPLAPAGSQRRASGWQSANPVGSAAQTPSKTPESAEETQAEPAPEPEPAEPETQPEPASEATAEPPAPPESRPGKPSASALLATDRPTSAPSPADELPTDSMRYPSMADAPTVITRPLLPANLPSLTPAGAPHSRGSVPGAGTPAAAPRRRGPTWLFLAVGVLVVAGLIVGATWFFSARSPGSTGGIAAPSGAVVNPQLDVESKLPTLPGTPNPNNSTMSVDKAVQLQVISAEEASKVQASGAQEVVYRASSDSADANSGYLLLAIPTSSTGDAANLVSGLRQTLTGAGFKADPLGQTDSETAYTGSNPTGRVSALWYASGSVVVGIGVSQPLDADPATLNTRLEQVRDSVVATLPAS